MTGGHLITWTTDGRRPIDGFARHLHRLPRRPLPFPQGSFFPLSHSPENSLLWSCLLLSAPSYFKADPWKRTDTRIGLSSLVTIALQQADLELRLFLCHDW